MTVLLDSDVVIQILRSRDQDTLARWLNLANANLITQYSPITLAEIWAGARPEEHAQINRFFLPLDCIPPDHDIGKLAGKFLHRFAKSHSLKIGDALIAATAVHTDAHLWTHNRKHYPIPELTFY
jgi:predicted nucleic acid-binding protein